MPQSEVDQFLQDAQVDTLNKPLGEVAPKAPEKDDEGDDPKNRRERRLLDRLERERQSNIELSAKLAAISEAQKFRGETPVDEHLKSVERIYGTNSPEAAEATELLKKALMSVEERATERAIEKFREEQRAAQERVREEERRLESFVDSVEDTFNTTMSKETEQNFFKLMERVSPKDSSGNIVEYADPIAVWELMQEKSQKKENRAKDLASRSMSTSSTNEAQNNQVDEATVRMLREAGII